ncbi:unannotated protein [freshwater metagenome]|uniref:Unannotated protein n=1 Tax=freshwater metagenome TaxID=449393 RepID=A0A6J7D0M4_9ZZZZ|nr:hypothetical protein [Actinomycetota bacterium]
MTVLKILTVCTHNRTRSVLMLALFGEQLSRHGVPARLASVGTFDQNQPATEPTVRLLAKRGLDVSAHLSSFVNAEAVGDADLIVTAERDHVVFIAGRWEGSFERTFTLPELLVRADAVGPRNGMPMAEWLALVNEGRPRGIEYLSDPTVLEIEDPTGQAPVVWRGTIERIDLVSLRLAQLLA